MLVGKSMYQLVHGSSSTTLFFLLLIFGIAYSFVSIFAYRRFIWKGQSAKNDM